MKPRLAFVISAAMEFMVSAAEWTEDRGPCLCHFSGDVNPTATLSSGGACSVRVRVRVQVRGRIRVRVRVRVRVRITFRVRVRVRVSGGL